MWKKTWLLGFLVVATALSGCDCGGGGVIGGNDAGNTTADGGGGGGGGGGNTDGGGGGGGGDTDGGGGGTTDGGGNGSATLGALALTPTSPILAVTGTTPVTQQFKVTGTFSDGHTEDVTGQATFSIDDTRLGLFGGGSLFTSSTDVGGTSSVRARIGTLSVSTPITVRLEQKVPDSGSSGLPANPDTKFGGNPDPDPTHKPKIVYPNNGVMVPPNLGQLEIHFLPNNASTTLFELAFSNSITDVRVYLRCYMPSGVTLPSGVSRGCIYTPDAKVWKYLAESNRGGQQVKLTVRATDDSGSGLVATSDPIALQFARAELKGALYYWTTSGGTGVMRYDFAGTGTQTANPVLRASNISTSVSCVGCHALSRNGKKVVAEVNGQNDGRLALVVDLSKHDPSATKNVPLAQAGTKLSNFESWNPDGTKFVGAYADSGASKYNLMIFNGDTAAFESEIANTGTKTNPANHPDWSLDGNTIAYMSMGLAGTNQRSFKGSINMVTANGSGGWNAPVTVVPSQSGKNRYYPAIAPDNSFLVYNESTCPTAGADAETDCNSDTDPSARLWAAKLQAGATRVEMAKANQGGAMDTRTTLTNSYPKWSPFVTRGNTGDTSRLMWLTFSSSRNYGLRTTPSSTSSENDRTTLLWMAAVDPDKMNQGLDPSYPAFALPFQDLKTSNHIAQWAQYLVSNGCATDTEACGPGGVGTCCNGLQCVQKNQDPPIPCDVSGACVCQPIPTCAQSFEKCSAAQPCCDGTSCVDDSTGGACSGSSCTCKPPCAGLNQACGTSACCDGLVCKPGSSGNTCLPPIN